MNTIIASDFYVQFSNRKVQNLLKHTFLQKKQLYSYIFYIILFFLTWKNCVFSIK